MHDIYIKLHTQQLFVFQTLPKKNVFFFILILPFNVPLFLISPSLWLRQFVCFIIYAFDTMRLSNRGMDESIASCAYMCLVRVVMCEVRICNVWPESLMPWWYKKLITLLFISLTTIRSSRSYFKYKLVIETSIKPCNSSTFIFFFQMVHFDRVVFSFLSHSCLFFSSFIRPTIHAILSTSLRR